jgi:hypothetical protein
MRCLRIALFIVLVGLGSNSVLGQEWSTPEALRAFGKSGDTVNPDLLNKHRKPPQEQNLKQKNKKTTVTNYKTQNIANATRNKNGTEAAGGSNDLLNSPRIAAKIKELAEINQEIREEEHKQARLIRKIQENEASKAEVSYSLDVTKHQLLRSAGLPKCEYTNCRSNKECWCPESHF